MTSELLASVAAVLAALVPLVVQLVRLTREVRKTHELVNSRMDELVELTRKAAFAEGRLDPSPPAVEAAPPRSIRSK